MGSEFNDINDFSRKDEQASLVAYPVTIEFIELANLHMHLVKWHHHPELEIIIVNNGNLLLSTSEKDVNLQAGQGIIINSNALHSIKSLQEDGNSSYYSLSFNPVFLFGYGDLLLSEKYLLPVVTAKLFQCIELNEDDTFGSRVLENVNEVIAINLLKRFGYELITKARLCEFWVQLINYILPNTKQSNSTSYVSLDESRVKDIISYIEEHYSEKITLENLADTVHLSKSECCRCFKRILNLSPIEYLMKYRIFIAASIIQNDDTKSISFSDLAFDVGFNNASYFNKVFRSYLNCTPREYRKKVNQDSSDNLLNKLNLQ